MQNKIEYSLAMNMTTYRSRIFHWYTQWCTKYPTYVLYNGDKWSRHSKCVLAACKSFGSFMLRLSAYATHTHTTSVKCSAKLFDNDGIWINLADLLSVKMQKKNSHSVFSLHADAISWSAQIFSGYFKFKNSVQWT